MITIIKETEISLKTTIIELEHQPTIKEQNILFFDESVILVF
jgi:hypothetical protein